MKARPFSGLPYFGKHHYVRAPPDMTQPVAIPGPEPPSKGPLPHIGFLYGHVQMGGLDLLNFTNKDRQTKPPPNLTRDKPNLQTIQSKLRGGRRFWGGGASFGWRRSPASWSRTTEQLPRAIALALNI